MSGLRPPNAPIALNELKGSWWAYLLLAWLEARGPVHRRVRPQWHVVSVERAASLQLRLISETHQHASTRRGSKKLQVRCAGLSNGGIGHTCRGPGWMVGRP